MLLNYAMPCFAFARFLFEPWLLLSAPELAGGSNPHLAGRTLRCRLTPIRKNRPPSLLYHVLRRSIMHGISAHGVDLQHAPRTIYSILTSIAKVVNTYDIRSSSRQCPLEGVMEFEQRGRAVSVDTGTCDTQNTDTLFITRFCL